MYEHPTSPDGYVLLRGDERAACRLSLATPLSAPSTESTWKLEAEVALEAAVGLRAAADRLPVVSALRESLLDSADGLYGLAALRGCFKPLSEVSEVMR